MYVDYIAIRDHFHDEHVWHCPDRRRLGMLMPMVNPNVLRVAVALHHAGFTAPEPLRLIAEIWRTAETNALTWPQLRAMNVQTLNQLEEHNVLRKAPQKTYAMVANQWRAPLYSLDLRRLDVRPAELRGAQERWQPDDFY